MLNQGRDSCTYSPGNFVPAGGSGELSSDPCQGFGKRGRNGRASVGGKS